MTWFGGGRSPLQRALEGVWKSDEDKQATLAALRQDTDVRAAELIPLLWIPDSVVRNTAAAMFVHRADVESTTALLQEMASQGVGPRGFGMRIVARLRAVVVTPAVESLLKAPNPAHQRLGWDVALELQGDARSAFAERALREAPSVIRLAALQHLVTDRGPESLRAILLSLVTDPDDRVRERAVESMAMLSGDDVLDAMLARFAEDNATVRALALTHIRAATVRAPESVRPRLLKLLSEGEDAIRRMSVEGLLQTGAPQGVVLEILEHCRSLVGWLRTRILNTLRTFGDEVLRPAVALLEHPDDDVRMQALVLCEHFEDPRLVGPVVKLLNDPDGWLRVTACETLGKLKDERAVPHLVKALEDDDARWAAIDALGAIGGETALRALVGLLRDPRAEVRLEVIQAAARGKDPRFARVLRQVIEHDTSQEVRTRATEMLRGIAGGQGAGEQSTPAVRSTNLVRPVDRILAEARELGASDVHFTVGEPPYYRVNGIIARTDAASLDDRQIREIVLEILDPTRQRIFEASGEVDFCHAVPGVGRYRANAYVQRRGTCVSFRCIPNIPPTFADLRLPGRLTELLDDHQGIILVSGPAGGGKSTTLAAIINLINETRSDHVITLEDPIEFVHPGKNSLVNQREIGRHTVSFARALRAALREDPDVVMVGEMRDIETIRMALMAAETGHLVIATMHTTSAVATVDRLIESFPPDEQPQVRMGLSESLKYVISQSLVPRADGKGRVAAYEVLKGVMNVGTLIRDSKTFQIPSLMQIGRGAGMVTLDQSLEELLDAGLITPETAYARAENKDIFEARLSTAQGSV